MTASTTQLEVVSCVVRTLPDVELGYRYVVLGDTVASAGTRIFFLADATRRASRPASGSDQVGDAGTATRTSGT
jgi:hypothetical protein